MFGLRRTLTVVGLLVVLASCGSDLPSRPDAQGQPKTTSTTSTSTTTTTTTTTTLPPVPVPGPVKLGAVCIVPGGVSQTADGATVYCDDRKNSTAKPYANGRLRWTASI